MKIRVLGSAAGGGFPQWNCGCAQCTAARTGQLAGRARTQVQLAWQAENGAVTLLNASPDLRLQIEATPDLLPPSGSRQSPICDVILTGGEIDQALGLLHLREFHPLRIHATPGVRRILLDDNSMFDVLNRFSGQSTWEELPAPGAAEIGGATVETLPVPGGYPGYVSRSRLATLPIEGATLGLIVTPLTGGGTLAYLPGLPALSDELLERCRACDVLLLDGTFWSDDEPKQIPHVTRTAREMGHMPISGPGGSLERLGQLRRTRRIFIHINNTNPILNEAGPEFRAVQDAGWEVASDGEEIVL